MAGKVFHLNRPLVAKMVRNWEGFYQNFGQLLRTYAIMPIDATKHFLSTSS